MTNILLLLFFFFNRSFQDWSQITAAGMDGMENWVSDVDLLFMSHVLNDLMMLLRQTEYLTCPASLSAAWFCFGSPPESKQKLFSWFSCLCLLILLQPRCQTANNNAIEEAAQFCSAVWEWVMFNLCHVKINYKINYEKNECGGIFFLQRPLNNDTHVLVRKTSVQVSIIVPFINTSDWEINL